MSSHNDQNAPTGDVQDNDYVSRSGEKNEPIPVQSDSARVDEPYNNANSDSDQQLERDDADAIDESNIIDSKTRGAKPAQGSYKEPGDEEGLPSDDGTSSV